MSTNYIRHVRDGLAWLKPHEVRRQAEQPLRIGLHGASDLAWFHMESFFAGQLSESRRAEIAGTLLRAGAQPAPQDYDLEIWSEELNAPPGSIRFVWNAPERTVTEILDRHEDLELRLARTLCPFRKPVTDRIVRRIARENAMFSVATALPDIIPLFSIPWAVGEFASDTAFLTANQIRMAFLLAAASNRPVGYREQRNEIGSIIAGAFGWRAMARELAGKIPLGAGLIPKAAIAYAGTRVVGLSLERLYRIGYGLTAAERKTAYEQALVRGKKVAAGIMEAVKKRRLAAASEPHS
jgi:hypothetical protein